VTFPAFLAASQADSYHAFRNRLSIVQPFADKLQTGLV